MTWKDERVKYKKKKRQDKLDGGGELLEQNPLTFSDGEQKARTMMRTMPTTTTATIRGQWLSNFLSLLFPCTGWIFNNGAKIMEIPYYDNGVVGSLEGVVFIRDQPS